MRAMLPGLPVTLLPLPPYFKRPNAGGPPSRMFPSENLSVEEGTVHWCGGDLLASISELYTLCGPTSVAASEALRQLTGGAPESSTSLGSVHGG